jgi:putative flippase GtrA
MVKMIALINSFKDKYFKPSMIRWGVVGMATFIIDYSLFIFLFDATKSVYMANLISTTVATAINYYTHHRWTFKTDQNHSRTGLKYLINLMFWWLVSTTIIKTLVVLDIDPRLAKIAPLILIVPVNYFVLNKIVFKKKS